MVIRSIQVLGFCEMIESANRTKLFFVVALDLFYSKIVVTQQKQKISLAMRRPQERGSTKMRWLTRLTAIFTVEVLFVLIHKGSDI